MPDTPKKDTTAIDALFSGGNFDPMDSSIALPEATDVMSDAALAVMVQTSGKVHALVGDAISGEPLDALAVAEMNGKYEVVKTARAEEQRSLR